MLSMRIITKVIQKKFTVYQMVIIIILNIVSTLLGRRKKLVLPYYNDPIIIASTFNVFLLFIYKIANIRAVFPLLENSFPPYLFESMDYILPSCTV